MGPRVIQSGETGTTRVVPSFELQFVPVRESSVLQFPHAHDADSEIQTIVIPAAFAGFALRWLSKRSRLSRSTASGNCRTWCANKRRPQDARAVLSLERLPREVEEGVRQQRKGQYRHPLVIEKCVRHVQQVAVFEIGCLDSFERYPDQAGDAARSNQA